MKYAELRLSLIGSPYFLLSMRFIRGWSLGYRRVAIRAHLCVFLPVTCAQDQDSTWVCVRVNVGLIPNVDDEMGGRLSSVSTLDREHSCETN